MSVIWGWCFEGKQALQCRASAHDGVVGRCFDLLLSPLSRIVAVTTHRSNGHNNHRCSRRCVATTLCNSQPPARLEISYCIYGIVLIADKLGRSHESTMSPCLVCASYLVSLLITFYLCVTLGHYCLAMPDLP